MRSEQQKLAVDRRPPGSAVAWWSAAAWVLGAATAARAQQPTSPRPVSLTDSASASALAFQGVTVIDVQTGRRVPGQTIVVVGNRIEAVGPAGRVRPPAGARVLRADGTFVIPGLWDMHVHVHDFANTFFPLFVANGVTGMRDMGTPFLDSMLQWRREIAEGHRVGPRLLAAGPSIISKWKAAQTKTEIGGFAPHMVGVDTPEEGRRIVDSLKRAGADLIKVYTGLRRDVYLAVVREAGRVGLPVGGHLTDSVSAIEASDSGLHSIEHGEGLRACAPDSTGRFAPIDPSGPGGVNRWDVARCREIAARLRRNDTWVLPGPYLACAACQLPWYREQSRYWPDSLFDPFNQSPGMPHEPMPWSVSLEQWADLHREAPPFRTALRAGIRIILGTDVAPYGLTSLLRPGFALHDALWDLVQGGFSPLQALQAATLNPAKYFYATDSLGTVAPGKVADLVFLDADPLADIFNTRRIRAVVANGRFYDRPDLDSLLVGAERLAKQSRRP